MADLNVGVRNADSYSVERGLALTSLAKTNMTQDELDSALQYIQLTATIIGVGADQTAEEGAWLGGTSDTVYVLSEGVAPAAGVNFGGVTGVTAAVVAYFNTNYS